MGDPTSIKREAPGTEDHYVSGYQEDFTTYFGSTIWDFKNYSTWHLITDSQHV